MSVTLNITKSDDDTLFGVSLFNDGEELLTLVEPVHPDAATALWAAQRSFETMRDVALADWLDLSAEVSDTVDEPAVEAFHISVLHGPESDHLCEFVVYDDSQKEVEKTVKKLLPNIKAVYVAVDPIKVLVRPWERHVSGLQTVYEVLSGKAAEDHGHA